MKSYSLILLNKNQTKIKYMKILNKKIILIIIFLMSIFTFAQETSKAKELLDQVSAKMKSYKTLHIEFNNSLDNNAEEVHQVTKGDAVLKGDLYVLNFLGNTNIFDGKKVYSINTEDQEVNITDPDQDIMTPAQFFSFYEEGYNFELAKPQTKNGIKLLYVKLLPIDNDSDFNYVLLGINSKTKHINKVIQKGKNGTDITLTITSFKTDVNVSDELFTFDKEKYEKDGYLINEF
jgi:outer membrane lipoprotein-sorting protein